MDPTWAAITVALCIAGLLTRVVWQGAMLHRTAKTNGENIKTNGKKIGIIHGEVLGDPKATDHDGKKSIRVCVTEMKDSHLELSGFVKDYQKQCDDDRLELKARLAALESN